MQDLVIAKWPKNELFKGTLPIVGTACTGHILSFTSECVPQGCLQTSQFWLISLHFTKLTKFHYSRLGLIHFSTIRYDTRYDTLHNMPVTSCLARGLSSLYSWHWKHACVCVRHLEYNWTLLSVDFSRQFVRKIVVHKPGRRVSTNWRQCFPMLVDAYVNVS